jgi:hypothetical protein
MRLLVAAIAALGFGAATVQAHRVPDTARLPRHQLATPGDSTSSTAEPNEAELLSHRRYKAKDRHEVHSSHRPSRKAYQVK